MLFNKIFSFVVENFETNPLHKQNICSDILAISGLDFTNTEGRVNIYRRLQNLGLIFFFGYKNTSQFQGFVSHKFHTFGIQNRKLLFPFFISCLIFSLLWIPLSVDDIQTRAFIKENSIAQNKMKNSTLKSNLGFRKTKKFCLVGNFHQASSTPFFLRSEIAISCRPKSYFFVFS